MSTLHATQPIQSVSNSGVSWRAAVAGLRAAREVPFDVSAAESWRAAFLDDVEGARAALDGAQRDARPAGCERVCAEMASLLVLVRGLTRIGLKDVVEACERAILLEIAATQRFRSIGELAASESWTDARRS